MIAERAKTFASGKIERARILKETELYNFWLNRPIAPETILYESSEGRSVSGNPEAIFRFLLKQQDLADLNHVWAVDDPTQLDRLSEEFASHHNVRFIRRNGSAYLRELATSRYLINNVGFPPEFVKREGQTYVHATDSVSVTNLDNGTLDQSVGHRNIMRNMICADFLVSGSAKMTEELYAHALQLANIFQGRIIESGLPRDDQHHGLASKRVVDVVFRHQSAADHVRALPEDGRTRVLLYPGGMVPNGITTSALNLLHNIDYDRFDITVICPHTDDDIKKRMLEQVNPKARLLFRDGRFTGGYAENKLRSLAMLGNTRAGNLLGGRRDALWSREWQRCFGGAKFDHILDFSGYSPFWSELFRHGGSATRTIWMHNDLAADAERVIHGHKPHEKNLKAVFASYRHFDNLVSVSRHLRDINRSKLSAWAPAEKFTFCRNTINLERIRNLAGLGSTAFADDLEATSETAVQFITVGRLSPEKNHARLISAFADVHSRNHETRLVIVGDGPLMQDLRNQTDDLGLADAITFTGHSENPYALMNESDAFVLSSDYEGQPMVLLEALVVGLPVITTAFGSVDGALPEGVGTIVERTSEGLAGAMGLVRLRTRKGPDFNGDSYNREVISEFERLFSKR